MTATDCHSLQIFQGRQGPQEAQGRCFCIPAVCQRQAGRDRHAEPQPEPQGADEQGWRDLGHA
jgi:hypothetical protein